MKLNNIINNLPGLFYRRKNDKNWTLEFISEGCFALTGYTNEGFFNGKAILNQMILNEDFDTISDQIQKANTNKETFTIEYRITHKNGTIRYCSEHGQAIYDLNGNPTVIEGFIQDITKQKETEQKLFENEARNKALLEAMPDMLFIQDLEGTYLNCFAPQDESLFVSPNKFIGKNMNEILPPHVFKIMRKAHNLAIKSGELQIVEFSAATENREEFFEARVVHLNNHGVLTIIREVTEQKIAEKQIIKNEAKIRVLLKTLPDVMILYDKQGNHLELHAPENHKLIAPYDEHIGKNINSILPKNVCHIIRQGFTNCETTKEIQTIEYSLQVNNKLVHLESRIIQTDEGNFLTIIRDVTENKDIEKSILENEERKRLALEVGEFGSWEWNLITDQIVRDEFQENLLDIENNNDKATYQSFIDRIHPKDRKHVKSKVADAIKTASSYNLEYRVIHNDKSVHWLKEKGRIFKNKIGKPVKIIGVTQDITIKKIAKQKLKEDEDALRNYTEKLENKVKERTKELTSTVQKLIESNLSLEDQVLITKSAESEREKNKYLLDNISKNFPKGFVAVFDADFNTLLVEGEEVEDLGFKGLAESKTLLDDVSGVPDNAKSKIKSNIIKTFKGEHCSFEISYQNRTFLVNTTPLYNTENKIEQVLLVHNNITLQKIAEHKVLKSLKQEQELSELKSRFISMASHEFRTPLSAILSSAILIEKLNATGNESKRLNHVTKIRSNVKDLVIILNNFLSLSKLQEGKIIAQPTSFNFIDFSKSVIKEIKGIKKEGQEIYFNYQQPNITTFLDQKLLKHIIFNLLSNAIKYSEEHKPITFNIETTNQHLVIEIKDEGIGIPKEDLNNMFQRFYRANNTTNIQGTGLGLNIVKQYTELMEGTISFKSELNVGTTFWVEFPLNKE